MNITAKSNDFASESGHWYGADGQPAYTLTGANGKERATTLRDARKLGLLPSVSTILQLEAKPQLTRWMIEQGVLAALTLPRLPYEEDTAFMVRALEDSKAQARAAAARGTVLHGVMEQSLALGRCVDPREAGIIQPVLDRIHMDYQGFTWNVERSFASPLGFGGKLDLCGGNGTDAVVIDYKFKDFSSLDRAFAYPEHCTQLAAYTYGIGKPTARCVNVFISTRMPGLYVVHEWPDTERDTGWECFQCLLRLWKLRKNYLTGVSA